MLLLTFLLCRKAAALAALITALRGNPVAIASCMEASSIEPSADLRDDTTAAVNAFLAACDRTIRPCFGFVARAMFVAVVVGGAGTELLLLLLMIFELMGVGFPSEADVRGRLL